VAALASEEDGASDQMVVLMSEESVSIEGVVALSPPLSPLDLEPGQHVAQGK
jgi:hypothetical protein